MVITIDELIAKLEASIKASGNAATWAAEHNFSDTFVSRVRKREKQPSRRLCECLGYQAVERYERIRP